jgi:hypothetical protein
MDQEALIQGGYGAELVPDPTKSGAEKLKGAQLKSARDALQKRVLEDTTWCCYCFCAGCGIDGMDLPCCFSTGEICCIGGTTKITACYDEDGCIATYSKCCCCISGCEYPIDNTPGIGCGSARCLSNIEERTFEDCTSVAAKNELDTLKKTIFCWSCRWCYQGFTYDYDPCFSNEGKLCCLWVNLESASCCDDGWIAYSGKTCCVVFDCSIPAGYHPGCVCCGCGGCGKNMESSESNVE